MPTGEGEDEDEAAGRCALIITFSRDRCGRIPYARFRCGLTFNDVRQELKLEQHIAKLNLDHMYIRRATVLGRMRQYKLAAYTDYLRHFNGRRRPLVAAARARWSR